jgi:hypothetical protein
MKLLSAIFGFFSRMFGTSCSTALKNLDNAITPEMKIDQSVDLIIKSHRRGNTVSFDFDEAEFTRAFPNWRNA